MEPFRNTSQHDRIQLEIISACHGLGIEAIQEHKGKDWRADVFVPDSNRPIAFEIQLSPQSLNRTIERQSKYNRDGIIGCWLFERSVANLNEERPDLPLFYVEEGRDSDFLVNLGDRRKVHLNFFLDSFISNNIRFRATANTKKKQLVKLIFYEMECWKCNAKNNLYYVETPFYSACNVKIKPEEALWGSNSMEFRPEVQQLARKFIENRPELNLNLGKIKMRHSKTVGNSYMSFGCYNCDSIFGDFFVMEAKIDVMDDTHKLSFQGEIELSEIFELSIPHWCLPDNNEYCGSK